MAARQNVTPCPHADELPPSRVVCDTCQRERKRAADRARPRREGYQAARYAALKADPEKWEARMAYQRAWVDRNRERVREYHRRSRDRILADAAALEETRRRDRERAAAWRAQDREHARELQRRWWQKQREDPVLWARLLESQRLNYRLRAERAGRPVAPVPEDRYDKINPQWTVEPEPLRQMVRLSGLDLAELAREAGVSSRLMGRLMREDSRVTVWAADRIAVTLGLHLDLLYPEVAA